MKRFNYMCKAHQNELTLLLMICLLRLIFFKIKVFQKSLQEYHQSVHIYILSGPIWVLTGCKGLFSVDNKIKVTITCRQSVFKYQIFLSVLMCIEGNLFQFYADNVLPPVYFLL